MSNYSDLLRDPRWQKKRLEVLSHHNFQCCECGNDESTLHVHHREYIKGRLPWEYPLSNFDSLCEACHETTHECEKAIKYYMNYMVLAKKCDLAKFAEKLVTG